MSSSRKRTEHIERIRYPNPLPLPPYPPKLLLIATPSSRYADPRTFGTRLATAHPHPIVVDSEAGMPLNMTDFPQAWYTDQELEADDNIFPALDSADLVDDEDAFLLSDLLGKLPTTSFNNANRGVAGKEIVDKGQVTWLRRTEYLGAEKKRREKELIASRHNAETIDSSRAAQLKRIRESFTLANENLASIRHPTKPGLRAVEEHQLLPDAETWASRYDVFRYGDPPGRSVNNKPINDPRLQAAILRPHKDLLDRDILSLFLVNAPELQQEEEEGDEDLNNEEGEDDAPERRPAKARKLFRSREEEIVAEDEEIAKLLKSRKEGDILDGDIQDSEETDPFYVRYHDDEDRVHLNYIRDYEPHDETSRKDQEVVLTFVDRSTPSDSNPDGDLPPVVKFEQQYRSKGADRVNGDMNGSQTTSFARKIVFYHPVSTRASLRVRRRKVGDPRPLDHWDAISLGKRSLSMYEKIERLHERRVVDNFRNLPDRLELPVEEEEGALAVQGQGQGQEEEKSVQEVEVEEAAAETEEEKKGAQEADSDAADEEGDDGGGEAAGRDASSDSGSDSVSDNGTVSDEAMDEDELAALQEDAGEDEPVSSGPGRRSRRRGTSPSTTAQGKAEAASADPAEDSEA